MFSPSVVELLYYDCFLNECDPCVLFVCVVLHVFATVESNFTTYAVQTIKQANKTGPNRLTLLALDKRKLSFDTFTFDTLVF